MRYLSLFLLVLTGSALRAQELTPPKKPNWSRLAGNYSSIRTLHLLSRNFARLLLPAGAIALLLGYLAGYAFLANFAYRVSIGIETLGLCFSVSLLLGGLTIVI